MLEQKEFDESKENILMKKLHNIGQTLFYFNSDSKTNILFKIIEPGIFFKKIAT